MKKFLKIAAIVLVFAMLASFAACGKATGVKVIDIDLTEEEYAFGVDIGGTTVKIDAKSVFHNFSSSCG